MPLQLGPAPVADDLFLLAHHELNDQWVMDREEAAAGCIAGLAELYAHTGQLSWSQGDAGTPGQPGRLGHLPDPHR